MKITYIDHSCFLVETDGCYYLFDYEKGDLPLLDTAKPLFVLSSHWHPDHYNAEIFSLLSDRGMQTVYAVLSKDIQPPANVNVLRVTAGKEYTLAMGQTLTTFKSTDVGVAFLLKDGNDTVYHAGDLNDWVWAEETDTYNEKMTGDYRKQMDLLCDTLNGREIDVAFVVLDPRQERDYDRGMCYFLDHISVKAVYPMHYWGKPEIIDRFLNEHPQYTHQIQKTEH